MRVHLLEFNLVLSDGLALGVKDEEPRACCAIVNGPDESVSNLSSVSSSEGSLGAAILPW